PSGYPQQVIDALNKTTHFVYDDRGSTTRVTDARDKTTTQDYDLFGRAMVTVAPLNQSAGQFITTPAPEYDANDNVTLTAAPNGAVTTASYDAVDRLMHSLAPVDQAGGPQRKTSYTYDKVGNVLSATEPRGNLTATPTDDFTSRLVYNEIYELTDAYDALDGRSSFFYDNVGNLIKSVDANKNATTDPNDYTSLQQYDREGRPTVATDAAGKTTSVGYDKDGWAKSQTDQAGNQVLFGYDARGLNTETKVPHDTGVVHTTKYEYDQAGNLVKTVSPRGVDTTDDPTDFATVTVYDALNRVKETWSAYDEQDPRYNTPDKTFYSYDDVGNVTKVSMPPSGGAPGEPGMRIDTQYTHLDTGWIASSTDPFGVKTDYGYNVLGRQTQRNITGVDGILSHAMTWDYYPDGKLKSRRDEGATFKAKAHVSDNSDAQSSTDGPDPWATSSAGSGFLGYDYATHAPGSGANTFMWTKPPSTSSGAEQYELFVRYPAVPGAATNATYTITHHGGPTQKTVDQSQNAGQWVSLGTYPFLETFVSLTLSDQANGTVVADAIRWVRVGVDPGPDTEFLAFDYQYDVNGNLVALNDNTPTALIDSYRMTYDELNRQSLNEELRDGVVQHTATAGYDPNSNLVRRTYDQRVDRFAYNERDLLREVTNLQSENDPAPKVTSYRYTARRQIEQITKPVGNTVDFTYYLDGRIRHQVEKVGGLGTIVAEHTLTYDANGNRATDRLKLMNADDNAQYVEDHRNYGYDPSNRVVQVLKDISRETYTYDAAGNIVLQLEANGLENTVQAHFYDRSRLQKTTVNGSGGPGGPINDVANYYYDPFGRLDTSLSNCSFTSYEYDGFDRKLRQRVSDDGCGGPTQRVTDDSTFGYDPLNRTRQRDRTHSVGSNPPTTSSVEYDYLGSSDLVLRENRNSGEAVTNYQYGLGGDRLSQITSGQVSGDFYYSSNPHGDVEAITGSGGNTRATYGYTAYGIDVDRLFTGLDKPDPAQPLKEPVNSYRFNAKRWDTSGTYDMGFRDYSPGLARFLTPDAYAGAMADLALGTTAITANRYAFAGGNPINNIEVDGHFSISDFLGDVGNAIGAGAATLVFGTYDSFISSLECLDALGTCASNLASNVADEVSAFAANPYGWYKGVSHEIWDPYFEASNNGNTAAAVGAGIASVAGLFFGSTELKALTTLTKGKDGRNKTDDELQADADAIHQTWATRWSKRTAEGVSVTTGVLDGEMVVTINRSQIHPAATALILSLGYRRVAGKKYMKPGQTDAEQMMLNAVDMGHVGSTGRIATSRVPCGPVRRSGKPAQNCGGRIGTMDYQGIRVVGKWGAGTG
ncbi:MAG TPA: RHS repeat-associated core domain-containing protein, partial [Candidatus Limnocylindrales bacterium]